MSDGWLRDALEIAGLGAPSEYPRNLVADAQRRLPVTVRLIHGLTVMGVRESLRLWGIEHPVAPIDRELHGCMVARAGMGILFVDSDDDERERRFTLAHELAHFLLEHLLPRVRALRAHGDSILPVLNGERAPTRPEALSAVLRAVPMSTSVHLMARGTDGSICSVDTEIAEQRADRLGLELIAPARLAAAEIRNAAENGTSESTRSGAISLVCRFGLPERVAASYVARLLPKRATGTTFIEDLLRH